MPPNQRRRGRTWVPEPGRADQLDHDGRARVMGGPDRREARVEGALAGESFVYLRIEREGEVDRARVVEVLDASPDRVESRCPHYGVCGGCSLMHMHPDAQVAHKQAVLLGRFAHHGLEPATILDPLRAEPWGYRRRARLGAKWVAGKDKVVVGFREKDHRFIADLSSCEVLAGDAGGLIPGLGRLIAATSLRERIPQIEVSVGDGPRDRAVVLRVLASPSEGDLDLLREFGERERVRVFLQPGGLDSVFELGGDQGLLHFSVPAPSGDIELGFRPTDFVQVNGAVNRAMVELVVDQLQLAPEHRVLDLFCGLGNFSLPIARRAGWVVGIEGDAGLVARAQANAAANQIANVRFAACDLFELDQFEAIAELSGGFDRVLIDPPRSGAQNLVERFDRIGAERVVYVACNPETLARDAAILVARHGYRLAAAGIFDMFPHTAHVESVAVFARG